MVTQESNHAEMRPRVSFKVGDMAFFASLAEGKILRELLVNRTEGGFKLLGWWRQVSIALPSFIQNNILRVRAGKSQTGVIPVYCGLSISLCSNSEHIFPGLGGLGMFIVPALPFFYSWEELYNFAFVEIRSIPLLIWAFLFTIGALINSILTWIGKSNPQISSRGDGLIYLGLCKLFVKFRRKNKRREKQLKPGKIFCELVLETAFIGSLGALFWIEFQDYTFAIFLWVCALCEAWNQIQDAAFQTSQQAIITA